MKIIDYKNLIAEFSCQELSLIRNAMVFVYNSIEDWEFQTRLGIERDVFFRTIQRIEDIIYPSKGNIKEEVNEIISLNKTNINIKITKDEFLGIANSLNEVCHGLRVLEFKNCIGADREIVYPLLKQVSAEFDKVNINID